MRESRSSWILLIVAMAIGCAYVGVTVVLSQDSGPAPAAPAPAPAPQPPSAAAPAAAPAEAATAEGDYIGIEKKNAGGKAVLKEGTGDLISITLDDVPLDDVVRMFTRISGANIIATAADLQGKNVTVNLTDVQWKPALSSILGMHNLALVEKELGTGVYSIVPKPADQPEPMISKSFKLHFSSVGDVSPVVRSMLPKEGTGAMISEFPSRNMIVVRSTAENIRDIEQLIKEIDVPTQQVCVETKFMELNDEASKQLGIRWDSLEQFGVKLAAGPFTYGKTVDKTKTDDETFSETHSRTHLEDASDTSLSSESGQLLYDRNHIPMQETPTYTLYDLNADGIYDPDAGEVVITRPASFTEKTSSEASRENSDTYNTSQSTTHDVVDSFAKNITEQQAAVLSADALELVISALKKTDGVSMLSNPKIIVSSGSTNAYFSFGGREPIIKTEIKTGTQDSPGDTLTAQLSTDITTDYIKQGYLETGVRLSVIPVVKTEDLIEATIRPKLVRKNGDKTIGVNSWPILFVKEIETKFTLRSGQTVAIGGLTDTQDEKHVAKVPLLGDIPLIGKYLFSHTQDIKGQKETIIFVSLTLAEPEKIAPNVGIPEASELVHKRMIQDETHRKEFKANIRQLQEAAAAEQQQLAEKEKKAAEKAAAARAASKAK